MKQIKLIVPNNWADITIKQYQEFIKVLEGKKSDKEKSLETVSIFCKIKKRELKDMAFGDIEKVAKILFKMTGEDPSKIEMKRNIKFKETEYGLITNMSKMTVGEFVDLESYCENTSTNLHKIMSVLYRKQIGKIDAFKRYTIEDYDPNEEKQKLMLELPMDHAMGVLNFFFHLGEKLFGDLVSYSEKLKSNKTKEHQVSEGLQPKPDTQKSGVGMQSFMN
jgi:hypothetical protein